MRQRRRTRLRMRWGRSFARCPLRRIAVWILTRVRRLGVRWSRSWLLPGCDAKQQGNRSSTPSTRSSCLRNIRNTPITASPPPPNYHPSTNSISAARTASPIRRSVTRCPSCMTWIRFPSPRSSPRRWAWRIYQNFILITPLSRKRGGSWPRSKTAASVASSTSASTRSSPPTSYPCYTPKPSPRESSTPTATSSKRANPSPSSTATRPSQASTSSVPASAPPTPTATWPRAIPSAP
mmetsp:Transcript_15247/g.27204  ORF Transcript_15247/g.27204 Transcript_15247/m.27204 type:complete len:237 (-) Transcript_15247:416-1126(-)